MAGGCALYVFLYSMFYFTKLEIEDPVAVLLYFGYTSLMALSFWLLTGTV